MKLLALALLLARPAAGFRAGRDAIATHDDAVRRAVDDALRPPRVVRPPPHEIGTARDVAPPIRHPLLGAEGPCLHEYWSRPDIHSFGNQGLGGKFHAAMAPLATKIIDVKAYGGADVRKNISHELRSLVDKTGARVADLCCGVGMSTRALGSAFHDAEFLVGVDASDEMISMATTISAYQHAGRLALLKYNEVIKMIFNKGPGKLAKAMDIDTNPFPSRQTAKASYQHGNAENTELPRHSFDLVTIMYSFHEVPLEGRGRIINEARRLLRRGGHLAIVDVSPTYEPSPYMLAGEPFVLEYQQNIDGQLAGLPGFSLVQRKAVVPGHVDLWLLSPCD